MTVFEESLKNSRSLGSTNTRLFMLKQARDDYNSGKIGGDVLLYLIELDELVERALEL